MPKVLARVTAPLDAARGPDVLHRVEVPEAWLESGATIEFELPRNLRCAACDGGGCDACGRSGAISLRGHDEPPELVRVTLPKSTAAAECSSPPRRALTLRIPGHGGLPAEPERPRGLLLLRVTPGEASDPALSRVRLSESAAPEKRMRRVSIPVALAVLLLILWITLLLWLRLSGRG